jgi:hypothetical protein
MARAAHSTRRLSAQPPTHPSTASMSLKTHARVMIPTLATSLPPTQPRVCRQTKPERRALTLEYYLGVIAFCSSECKSGVLKRPTSASPQTETLFRVRTPASFLCGSSRTDLSYPVPI